LPFPHDPDLRWYKPTWSETARLLGWRWVYFLPAVAVLAVLAYLPFDFRFIQILLAWWKPAVFAVAVPLVAFATAAKNIIRARTEPFCIHCGYTLLGLPDHHPCPECGRPFSLATITEYRRDPDWFIERYKQHQKLPTPPPAFEAGKIRRKKSKDGT
jgi:hypothetical protein